jgi:hypothetical protein
MGFVLSFILGGNIVSRVTGKTGAEGVGEEGVWGGIWVEETEVTGD